MAAPAAQAWDSLLAERKRQRTLPSQEGGHTWWGRACRTPFPAGSLPLRQGHPEALWPCSRGLAR